MLETFYHVVNVATDPTYVLVGQDIGFAQYLGIIVCMIQCVRTRRMNPVATGKAV